MGDTAAAARAPITPAETHILKELVKTLMKTESHFLLWAEKEGRTRTGSLQLPFTIPKEAQELLDACVPSPHGRGKETVYDESYRIAREMQEGNFALTTDILNESGVLESITALISPRNPSDGIIVRLYKLNSYVTGGFFKPHQDTPKSDRHIGTLVVALPVPFKGGALRVSHEGKEVLFDWGKDSLSFPEKIALPWAFLFSDVEHEVLPVTSGTRLTLAYDVFASPEAPSSSLSVMDGTTLPFYSDLKDALKNPNFLTGGGKLGIAFSHAYPLKSQGASESFASQLKGDDAALHRALSTLEISVELRVVFSLEPDEYDDSHSKIPDDEFGPVGPGVDGRPAILYSSDTFDSLDCVAQEDETEKDLAQEYCDASVEPEIIWARRPPVGALYESGKYITYGNSASIHSIYISAALVLDIPPVGQSVRATL